MGCEGAAAMAPARWAPGKAAQDPAAPGPAAPACRNERLDGTLSANEPNADASAHTGHALAKHALSARRVSDAGGSFTLVVPGTGGRAPIEIAVTRKRVKNLNLRVHRDGSVSLSVPLGTPVAAAQAFLDRRAGWIAAHVERMRERAEVERAAGTRADDAAAPTTIPLWGALVPTREALGRAGLLLRPRTRTFGELRTTRGTPGGLDAAEVERLVQELYRREVARALPDVAERVETRVGVRAASWQVRRMTSRWGSCTPAKRAIRISTALAAYPPECLEMVVAHELVHLMEPSHDARFHALLDRFCPENRGLARLLKQPAREVARRGSAATQDPQGG